MSLINGHAAKVDLANAALDPDAAIAAIPEVDTSPPVEIETIAGVVAVERVAEVERVHGITAAVEVEPIPPHSRWRWFVCYHLMKLAAWVYPFRIEFYRTRYPYEQ